MRIFLFATLLLGACASTRVYPSDVERQFAADSGDLWLRVPSKEDLNPARAANPAKVMHRTEQLASEFLARAGDGESLQKNYVAALLACTYLAQGRTDAARTAVRGIKTRRTEALARENAVVFCTVHAVDAIAPARTRGVPMCATSSIPCRHLTAPARDRRSPPSDRAAASNTNGR